MITYPVIGIMSGTSLDGLDICYATFTEPDYNFNIVQAETIPYNEIWKKKLSQAIYLSSEEILKLNIEYGFYLGEQVNIFCEKYNIQHIECIASHGHTIFHNPQEKYTLQIGHGAAIAKLTRKQVVCDFRSQDVILGGQGAPLVPFGDEVLFQNYNACLNLGGFSNISFKKNNTRIAFDICPVNTVLNYIANKKGLDYDLNGNNARIGNKIPSLFRELNQLDFYQINHPKSLGIEWVMKNIYPLINNFGNDFNDLLATFTYHISEQITKIINHNQINSVLISGGGTNNHFLIELIKSQTEAKIHIPDENLINFKEALIFALLGLMKLQEKNNVFSSVTGAKKDHCSGIIYLP